MRELIVVGLYNERRGPKEGGCLPGKISWIETEFSGDHLCRQAAAALRPAAGKNFSSRSGALAGEETMRVSPFFLFRITS